CVWPIWVLVFGWVATEGSLGSSRVCIIDILDYRYLGTIDDAEALLITITDNCLPLVEFTARILFGLCEVGIKDHVKVVCYSPLNIDAERVVFRNGFVPVLDVIEGAFFVHINGCTIFIDSYVLNTAG